jgi:hypothetical protein
MALHHLPDPHWRAVERYSLGKLQVASLSDFSYRRLCKQLVEIGLAESFKRSEHANDYKLTQYGHAAAEVIEKTLRRIDMWKTRAAKNKEK